MWRYKEYLVLLAVIIGVGLYLFLSSSDGVHYALPDLEPFTVQEADGIMVDRSNGSLSLRQENGTWKLEGQGYAAEEDKVQGMLEQAADPGLTALVSESGQYSRYHLDEERGIRVRIFSGENTLRQLWVGKSAGDVQGAYIKLPQDPNIYLAERDLRGTFQTSAKELRDKTVFSTDPGQIRTLRLAGKNASRTLKRKEKGKNATQEPVWKAAGDGKADSQQVRDLLKSLESLRCRGYKESLSKNGTAYTITLENEASHRLRIFVPEKERPTSYEASSSQSRDPFQLSTYRGEELISPVRDLLGVSQEQETPSE